MASTSLPTTQFHESTVNFIGHDQFNLNQNIHIYQQNRELGPVSPRSINDSPAGRLSVHFTGRNKEVDFLRTALSKTQGAIPSCCAVYGMPGVGKSQLVLHYAKESFDGDQYSYIFWISATSVDKLKDGLAKVLDLVRHPDRHLQDQDAKLTAARLWLEGAHENWLLIFDNVHRSSIDFFETHLPRRNVRGNVLFTTRTEDVAEVLVTMGENHDSKFQLHPLELRDSANLLLQDASVDMEPSLLSRAEELVKCVGCLPLAVVQAASFMRKTHTTLDEMYEMYTGNEKIVVVEWENDLTRYQERSVATTFTKQFDELLEESADISNLFKILSFLDPENIPVTMITEGAKEWLHPQHPLQDIPSQPEHDSHIFSEFRSLVALVCSAAKFRTSLQKLQALSLVEYRSTERNSSLWIHDLIRFIKHEGSKKEDTYREWLQSSISLICGASRRIGDPESPERWAACEEFMPHFRSLNRLWNNEYGVNLELIHTNAWIALYLTSRARYDEAESLLKPVLEVYETKFGCEHRFTLTSVNNLAYIYQSQGRYDEAERLHKRALASGEEHLGAYHPSSLTSMDNLAGVYLSQGRYDEAETLHKRALAAREKHLGAEHPGTLTSANNLAVLYKLQGRYDEAETLHKRALARCEENLGANHQYTLTSACNLAQVYCSQGRYEEAETLHKRALAGAEEHLGADHPDTLTSANNLAEVYRSQGRYEEAETLHKRVLAAREEHLGTEHPGALTSANNLAQVYCSQGRYEEAETLHKRALAGAEEHLGADHPVTLTSANNLAEVYRSQGRYDEAETLHKRALAGGEEHLGADHPGTLTSANNLAQVYCSQGRYDEAETLLKRALAGHLGADHPDMLTSLDNLAQVYGSQGRYDEAETHNKRALAGFEKYLGADHPNTLMSVHNLAQLYHLQRQYCEAETLYKRAVAGFEKSLGAHHPITQGAAEILAHLYRSLGRLEEAESIVQKFSLPN